MDIRKKSNKKPKNKKRKMRLFKNNNKRHLNKPKMKMTISRRWKMIRESWI